MVRKSHNSYFEMTVESVFRYCYDSRFPTKMYNSTAVFAMRNPIGQKNVLYRIPISQFKVCYDIFFPTIHSFLLQVYLKGFATIR
jgi:hypothetical protein